MLIGLAALFFVAIFAIVFLNAFGIQDELLSLKIVRRLLYGDKSSRFKTWTSYLFSGDWLRYPFGGQKSEFAYHGEWVHNLWLDILNKVGLIPFVIAVIFTITSIRSAYGAAVRMKKANHNLLSNQIASLGLGALLICMPEPVVDANPYFFFAILMLWVASKEWSAHSARKIPLNRKGDSKDMSQFKDKILLITGGTGSFGNAVLRRFLTTDIAEIRILSRDEKKQDDMRHTYQELYPQYAEKIKFYIGDVRITIPF